MDEYLTIVATLLGAVIGGIIGFAGAYLVEGQRFKKERVIEMRDKIYGPMLMATSRILEAVKLFQNPIFWNDQNNLKKLEDDYLFFALEQDLKSRWSEVMDRFEKYQKVRYAAEIRLNENSKQQIMEISGGLNIGVSSVFLGLFIGEITASTLDLQTAIFLKLAPKDFIKKEKEKWGEDSQIEARFSGVKTTLEKFESLYASILTKMEKEQLYHTENEQRTRLIKELESLLGQIEPFVKPR